MNDSDSGLPIRLLHDRVLVRIELAEGERRSSAGILIPATASVGRRLSWAKAVGVGSPLIGDAATGGNMKALAARAKHAVSAVAFARS